MHRCRKLSKSSSFFGGGGGGGGGGGLIKHLLWSHAFSCMT